MKKNLTTSFLIALFSLLFSVSSAQTVYLSSVSGGYSVIEGNTYSFNVNLYSVCATPVVVDITTSGGTASATDYSTLTTTVIIPAGQLSTSTALTIPTANDSTIEPNETLVITGTVTSGNTTNTTTSTTLFIIDNDTVPTVSIGYSNNLQVYEGGSSPAINFQLSNPYSSNVVINCFTTNGTAGSSDYTAITTTKTILAGQTSASVALQITDDSLTETDETFTLTGTITSGNTTNSSVIATITIVDNDTMPSININNTSATEGDDAYFNLYLDRPFNSDVSIQLATSNGTAGAADYTSTTLTKTILAGNTNTSFTIPTTDDTLDEPAETFTVTGIVTSGNTTNSTVISTATITDDDGLPDLIYYTGTLSTSIEEGQNASFYVGLSYPSTVDTVIQLSTQNGTAGSSDYTPLSATVTIPAGDYFYYNPSLYVPTILDQLQESDETFTINAVATSGNTFNTNISQTITILDNYNINAQNDAFSPVAEVGGTYQVLTNDTLHGLPLNYSDITITLGANAIGATLNAQGVLTIPSSTPMGYYQINYTVCEVANPSSCDTAYITIQVVSPLEVTFTLSYTDYNADGYTSAGDLINYQFSVKNNGNAAITNIVNDFSYNMTILGGPIASLNPGQTDTTTFTAVHIITQDDINFGNFESSPNQGSEISFKGTYNGYDVTDMASAQGTFSLPIPDGIKFNAFVDSNSNGVQDNSEVDFPLGHFNYEINSNGVIHNLYNNLSYIYESNPTTTYNLTYTVDSLYTANNTCSVSYPSVTVAPGSGITTYNFPINVTPYQDLAVSLHNSYLPPLPGFYYYNYITYTNNSNVLMPSGTITFTKDSALSLLQVSEAAATLTATGFTFNFTNLNPYETRYIWIKMQVPNLPTVALGQLVNNSASINLPAGDILPSNNNSAITQTIVGAYDPNAKSENHGGRILYSTFTSNDYLTYTIQFENTGTANAINIKVEDELDAQLDETTLKMIDASAPYSLERIDRNLVWKFSGINLPPAVPNSLIGHGFVTFQIKPKPGYAVGDIIPNSADIYFDFNPAIVTDTCNTEFVTSLSKETFAFENLNYFPNPVKNTLTLSNSSAIESVEITSLLGQKVVTKTVNDLQAEINLSSLSNGVYFVKVTSEGQEKTIKIIKE